MIDYCYAAILIMLADATLRVTLSFIDAMPLLLSRFSIHFH